MPRLIVAVADPLLYERHIHTNGVLRDAGIRLHPLTRLPRPQGAAEGRTAPWEPAELYNAFLDSLPPDEEDWLIFCPEYAEWLQNPCAALEQADKGALHGVLGVNARANLRRQKLQEHLGRVEERAGGATRLLGLECPAGTTVEVLGCRILIAHSSLLREGGPRFDPGLGEAFLVEDFCLRAKSGHGVPSRILPLSCRLHSDLTELARRSAASASAELYARRHGDNALLAFRPDGKENIFLTEKKISLPEGLYRRRIEGQNRNIPAVLAEQFLRAESCVLDLGCAHGDIGAFFQRKKQARMWGMDYDRAALDSAAQKGVYTELLQVDLDRFHPEEHSGYYRFFDHILMADVLEHLRSPLKTLGKCALFLREGGSFLVSLPNVSHSYVISNLLLGDFHYDR
ncbi:MAG: class I SAM-dependent methyltransferase, partial [Deltaproteobacteria bacterium]|nr:class I SAM-dependent methyltransferase [Deltaproteobacteria bacterium]